MQVLLRTSKPDANNKTCIEYVGLRAKALPLHRPMEFQQEWRNLSTNATAIFTENRPYEAVHYYLLIVSNGRVSFDYNLLLNTNISTQEHNFLKKKSIKTKKWSSKMD